MKVGFGYEKSRFSRDKYGNCGPKVFGGTIAKTALFLLFGIYYPSLLS
jgi:hypothetical protein